MMTSLTGVGKAALVRSQSLASRPHIHTFFAGLLSVHTLAKPSLEFEKPGTHGDSGRDSGDSGELSQGLMGTQGAQTTHFGELSEELRGSLPSDQSLRIY